MPTLGRVLASERVRQNLDLEQVAAVTRISTRLLAAIELDDFEQLPGRVFARNFIRQYAEFLRLDADAVVAQFDREQSPEEPAALAPNPAQYSRGFTLNVPALADLFGSTTLTSFLTFVITIAVGAAGVWTFNNWGAARAHVAQNARAGPAVKAPPVKPAKPAAHPANEAAAGGGAASVHVEVLASDACWTRITADGKVLFAGTLNAGESREIEASSVVDLRAGSAGALIVKLNGNDIPPLGPKGQIRIVTLTASGAQVRTPTPDPVSEPL